MSDTQSKYAELADETKSLNMYRKYREQAIARRDEAIADEEQNIQHESRRIEDAEARIRELVKELGLA